MLLILGSFLLSACFSQKEIISKNLSENDSIFTEEIVIIEPTIIYKNETYPSSLKIFIWDKIFTPITILLDFLTAYRFGKNILCVIKKIEQTSKIIK